MIFAILLLFAVLLLSFGLLWGAVLRRNRRGSFDPLEWLDNFSADSYRPMERLLDSRDYEFLAAQRGFQPVIARRLRRERIAIFHSYLSDMIRDFHRLLLTARVISVFSIEDQSDFVATLWRVRWTFYASVATVELHVLLHWLGLGSVDARRLLASIERVEGATLRLMPA